MNTVSNVKNTSQVQQVERRRVGLEKDQHWGEGRQEDAGERREREGKRRKGLGGEYGLGFGFTLRCRGFFSGFLLSENLSGLLLFLITYQLPSHKVGERRAPTVALRTLLVFLLEPLRELSPGPVANHSSVDVRDGRQLSHGARGEHLVGGLELG